MSFFNKQLQPVTNIQVLDDSLKDNNIIYIDINKKLNPDNKGTLDFLLYKNRYAKYTKSGTNIIITIHFDNPISIFRKDENKINLFNTILEFCRMFTIRGINIEWEQIHTDYDINELFKMLEELSKHIEVYITIPVVLNHVLCIKHYNLEPYKFIVNVKDINNLSNKQNKNKCGTTVINKLSEYTKNIYIYTA